MHPVDRKLKGAPSNCVICLPLGMAQWKRASFRVDAGTSGFIYISDSDRTVPAELGKELLMKLKDTFSLEEN